MLKSWRAALGVALALLALGARAWEVPSGPAERVALPSGDTMPTLGCNVWGLSPMNAYKSVLASLGAGMRMVETSQHDRNEGKVYKAIKDSGVPREEVFIISKLEPGKGSPDEVRRSIDASLAKLGGTIDLMVINWPYLGDTLAWRILEEYQQSGKIRMIGLCEYEGEDLSRILSVATINPVILQSAINPYNAMEENVRNARRLGIAYESYAPMGKGRRHLMDDPTLGAIAERHHKTPAQVMIRWCLQRGMIAMPACHRAGHAADDVGAFSFSLSAEEMAKIAELDRGETWVPVDD
ncbi:MAG: aldo/keto reductase [Succinivibrionaceae bacterium]|nr:aldo/keto reductase [Succinivibrionaceae bacterium]